MNQNALQPQIDSINQKLDVILEEIELQRRHRREMEDLKEDLTRVGKDVYQTALVELDDVHDYMNTGDVLALGKKLLRNVNTISQTIEQLESIRDFLIDFAPISRELTVDLMNRLDELDRKGYFTFVKELSGVADTIVTSFTPEDVKNLGDNVVTILSTVKSLTQPDMLQTINNAIGVYKKLDVQVPENVSLLSLLKEINTPEMKRGLAFAITFLKSVANQPVGSVPATVQPAEVQ
ncbi:MAG: DUF1641 domain-containing protein [Bacteroidetes bacterium]|nr:DUF1641 domain-containing protein [Bacteroidota bacterium]